jgi:two-component system, LytTR family, response regulator
MTNLNYLIIEGEPENTADLKLFIERYIPNFLFLGKVRTIHEASVLLAQQTHHTVIFMDIKLTASMIIDFFAPPFTNCSLVTLITATVNGYTNDCPLSTHAYFKKPYDIKNLIHILWKIRSQLQNTSFVPKGKLDIMLNNAEILKKIKKIGVPYEKGIIAKDLSELIYLKAAINYSELYFTGSVKHIVPKTLGEQETLLTDYNFFRIHQSYLVNLQYFDLFDTQTLTLTLSNGLHFPVSNRRKAILLEKLKTIL